MNQIALIAPNSRLPLEADIARQFGLDAPKWKVLIDQIFPAAKTTDAILLAMSYCNARGLDIFKKPVHIVPMWSSTKRAMVETVWPGICEIRTTATRTGEYAGMDEVVWGPMVTKTFSGVVEEWTEDEGRRVKRAVKKSVEVSFPEWASVTVYRIVKGVRCPFNTKLWWIETYGTVGKTDIPNDMWIRRTRSQFDKCLEAAALRKAFPEETGNTYVAEEMEGKVIDAGGVDVPAPKQPPVPPSLSQPLKPQPMPPLKQVAPPTPPYEDVDPETGEVIEDEGEEEGEEEDDASFDEAGALARPTADQLLSKMDAAMKKAKTDEQVQAVWKEHDLPATFVKMGDAAHAVIAKALYKKHLNRVLK